MLVSEGVWDGMGLGGRRIIKKCAGSGRVDAVRFGRENGGGREEEEEEEGVDGRREEAVDPGLWGGAP